MKDKTVEFTESATNVYRTKEYIVKQSMGVKYSNEENNVVFSHDTFYKRTRFRDSKYKALFCRRKHIDGKRLPTSMYTRTYVD